MTQTADLPDVGALLASLAERVAPEQRPLLIALAERMAAARYRDWAEAAGDPARRDRLLACADREEQIASRVEALFPEAAGIQQDILAKNADLPEISRSLFADRPMDDQYTLQARGERAGAATWRRFAELSEADEARQTFRECALLEEANAEVLEALLAEAAS